MARFQFLSGKFDNFAQDVNNITPMPVFPWGHIKCVLIKYSLDCH